MNEKGHFWALAEVCALLSVILVCFLGSHYCFSVNMQHKLNMRKKYFRLILSLEKCIIGVISFPPASSSPLHLVIPD